MVRRDVREELLALGNGGSATDAMDLVADLREPPHGWAPRPALDLTEDAAVLTAIANDVGVEAAFSRQVIAYGREGDVLRDGLKRGRPAPAHPSTGSRRGSAP